MRRDELLAEITRAFPFAPPPGESTLLAPGTEADEAARSIRAALGGRAWPDIPDNVLREQYTGLALLSPAGFHYYLPAFLCFAVREPMYQGIASLLALLKLPIELHGPAVAQLLASLQAGSPPPGAEVADIMQEQLTQTNRALNRFITRASRLAPAQGKAIHHFLAYLRDEAGSASSKQELAVAIERYWFQFA